MFKFANKGNQRPVSKNTDLMYRPTHLLPNGGCVQSSCIILAPSLHDALKKCDEKVFAIYLEGEEEPHKYICCESEKEATAEGSEYSNFSHISQIENTEIWLDRSYGFDRFCKQYMRNFITG